jgi:hypothetical protein
MYVVLGGVLTIGALVAAGLYIRNAQADPRPSTETASASASAPSTSPGSSGETSPKRPTETDGREGGPAAPSAAAVPSAPAPIPPATSSAPAPDAPAPTTAPVAASIAPDASASARTESPASSGETSPRRPRPLPPAARGATLKEAARGLRPGPGGPVGAPKLTPPPPAIAEPPAQPAVDFDQLETEIDQLVARAAVVNRSLDTMQQQQARQGLSLRGDMAGRQTTMNLNLTRAQQAVQQQNAGRALKFKAMAEADLEALERFLGR